MATEADFAAAVENALRIAHEKHRLRFAALQWMIDVYGALETARNYLNSDKPSRAFKELAAHGCQALSLEAIALEDRFQKLFTKAQLERARGRVAR